MGLKGSGGIERVTDREIEKRGRLNAPSGEQDDENNDNETGAASQEVVAGTESISTAAEQQENEKNDDDVHERLSNVGLLADRLTRCPVQAAFLWVFMR